MDPAEKKQEEKVTEFVASPETQPNPSENTQKENQESNNTSTNTESNGGENVQHVVIRNEPEKELVSWIAAARSFKRRDRQFYVTTISIAALVCLVLFIAEGAMPVILIISVIFLYYVLSTVPPENITYKLTNKGIKIDKTTTPWEFLGRFWFGERHGSTMLFVEAFVLPGRLELVVDPAKREEIKKIMSQYLVEEEIPASRFEKVLDWFSKKLPQ